MIYLGSVKEDDYFYNPASNYIYYLDTKTLDGSKWHHSIYSKTVTLTDADRELLCAVSIPEKRIEIKFHFSDVHDYIYDNLNAIIEKKIFDSI